MLRGLFGGAQEDRAQATTWGDWPGDAPAGSAVTVNQTTALQLLVVSGCVRLITDSIATLPIDVYRERPDGTKEEVDAPRWLKQPTTDLDFISWATQILTSLLLHGNAYCVVTRSGSQIVELIPVEPSLIYPAMVNNRKVFMVSGREFKGEILHIPALMLPGAVKGLAPLEYAAQTMGLGLAAQGFAKDQFESSLNMPGVISFPGKASPDPATIAKTWRRNRSRGGRGLPGVLEAGGTFMPTSISNEAAQFLQSRQWSAAEIAAQVYMVDPSDLGIPLNGSTLTYANLEQRNIRRLQVTFLPWIVRLEKALSALLPQPRYVKFNVDGLLRGDSSARWSTYATAMTINEQAATVGMGPVLTTNEMRQFEDLNKLDQELHPPTVAMPSAPQPQANAVPLMVENHVHLPNQPDVHVHSDVHVPEQRTPDVHVSVEPAATVVDVAPTTVNIPPTEVRVNVEGQQAQTTVRTVVRDGEGRIAQIIDEVK